MDQAALAHQAVSRHPREHREDTGMEAIATTHVPIATLKEETHLDATLHSCLQSRRSQALNSLPRSACAQSNVVLLSRHYEEWSLNLRFAYKICPCPRVDTEFDIPPRSSLYCSKCEVRCTALPQRTLSPSLCCIESSASSRNAWPLGRCLQEGRSAMAPHALRDLLESKFIYLSIAGKDLRFTVPQGAMTGALIQLLRKDKQSLIRLLSQDRGPNGGAAAAGCCSHPRFTIAKETLVSESPRCLCRACLPVARHHARSSATQTSSIRC